MNFRCALLLTFVFLVNSSYAQEKIDNNISINFPQKPISQEFSENIKSTRADLKAFYFNTEKESFIVFRTILIEEGKEVNEPASSEMELDEIYNNDIKSQINAMRKKGFVFSDSTKFDIENFKAYRLKYTLVDTNDQGAETVMLFLNGVRYVFTYSKVDTFNEDNKDKFLNSISISNPDSTFQIANTTSSGIDIFKYCLYAALAVGFIIYFRIASKNKSKLGINLNTVYCPKCNNKQPVIRMPTNASQIMYGGTTCPNCKTNMDKYGNIII